MMLKTFLVNVIYSEIKFDNTDRKLRIKIRIRKKPSEAPFWHPREACGNSNCLQGEPSKDRI